MKTKLPPEIKTIEQAKELLKALFDNNEDFHPEDDAHTILWSTTQVSEQEADQLNKLMNDIYNLPGNDGRHCDPMVFDPCEYLWVLREEDLAKEIKVEIERLEKEEDYYGSQRAEENFNSIIEQTEFLLTEEDEKYFLTATQVEILKRIIERIENI